MGKVVLVCFFFCRICPIFVKIGKMLQKLSSAAVVIGTLRVKPLKPSVLFVGLRQTVLTQFRRHWKWCLISVSAFWFKHTCILFAQTDVFIKHVCLYNSFPFLNFLLTEWSFKIGLKHWNFNPTTLKESVIPEIDWFNCL